jgi:hypothetical protein
MELVNMVAALSKNSGIAIPDLLEVYGNYFFIVLHNNYGIFLDRVDNLFDFFASIQDHIHVEVKKLYPEAELPAFEIEARNDKEMSMVYKSERKLSDFALGLMGEAANHYKENVEIEKELLDEEGITVRFLIKRT